LNKAGFGEVGETRSRNGRHQAEFASANLAFNAFIRLEADRARTAAPWRHRLGRLSETL